METERWLVSFVHNLKALSECCSTSVWNLPFSRRQSGDISSERFCRPVMWLKQPRRHMTELHVRLLTRPPSSSVTRVSLALPHVQSLCIYRETSCVSAQRMASGSVSILYLSSPESIRQITLSWFILTCQWRINDSEMRLTFRPNCWGGKKKKKHLISNENDNLSTSAHQKQQDRWHLCHWANLPAKRTILKRRSTEIVYKPLTRGESCRSSFSSSLHDKIRRFVCHWSHTTRNNVWQTQRPAATDDKIKTR